MMPRDLCTRKILDDNVGLFISLYSKRRRRDDCQFRSTARSHFASEHAGLHRYLFYSKCNSPDTGAVEVFFRIPVEIAANVDFFSDSITIKRELTSSLLVPLQASIALPVLSFPSESEIRTYIVEFNVEAIVPAKTITCTNCLSLPILSSLTLRQFLPAKTITRHYLYNLSILLKQGISIKRLSILIEFNYHNYFKTKSITIETDIFYLHPSPTLLLDFVQL